MSLDHLALDIHYDVKMDKFEVGGNVNRRGQYEIVETFLRMQIGAGEDKTKPNKKDRYHIRLTWYPDNDSIEVVNDTGNKGLRDGILLHFLKNLDK